MKIHIGVAYGINTFEENYFIIFDIWYSCLFCFHYHRLLKSLWTLNFKIFYFPTALYYNLNIFYLNLNSTELILVSKIGVCIVNKKIHFLHFNFYLLRWQSKNILELWCIRNLITVSKSHKIKSINWCYFKMCHKEQYPNWGYCLRAIWFKKKTKSKILGYCNFITFCFLDYLEKLILECLLE